MSQWEPDGHQPMPGSALVGAVEWLALGLILGSAWAAYAERIPALAGAGLIFLALGGVIVARRVGREDA